MAKSQETWSKKEKEDKKKKKKKEKEQKKEERKANKGTKSFEDMIAYIDENGNFTVTYEFSIFKFISHWTEVLFAKFSNLVSIQ